MHDTFRVTERTYISHIFLHEIADPELHITPGRIELEWNDRIGR